MFHRAALLALLILTACHRAPRPFAATVLVESPPETLDGRMAFSSNAERVAHLIAPGLVTYGDDGSVVADLAQRYQFESPTRLVFHLRPGARFQDGTPVTARDVVATFQSVRDPALRSPLSSKLDAIQSITAVDPLTVRFDLKRPYAPLLAELSISIYPARLVDPAHARQMARHPVGAGPFRVARWDADDALWLDAFPGYFGGAPRLPRVEIRTVRDETTRVLELLKGRADLTLNAVSPQMLSTLAGSKRVRVETVPGTGYAYLIFNLRDPKLQDPRLREALSCAIDREALVKYKFEGTATPATGMLPHTHWAYRKTPLCDNDLARAKQLLDAAGFPDPGNGEPRLTLSYESSTDRFRKSVAQVIAAQIGRVGVKLQLRALEFGTFSRDVKQGSFELATLKWSAVVEPDLMRWVYDSHFVPSAQNQWEGLNRGDYQNPAYDALVEQATTLQDRPARAALYGQAQAILARDLPVLPLWHENTIVVRSAALHDFQPSGNGFITGLAHAYKDLPDGGPVEQSPPAPSELGGKRSFDAFGGAP